MAARAFNDFPARGAAFLRELERNNNKAWFDANKARYQEAVAAPALRFAESLGERIRMFSPHIRAEPRIGGSVFRIQRDVRFSKDKSPYKTHIGIRLRDERFHHGAKCEGPLYYVELGAGGARFGVGVKSFSTQELAAYRRALSDARALKALAGLIAKAEASGGRLDVERLVRMPRDVPDTPLALCKGIFTVFAFPLDDVAATPALLRCAASVFRRHAGVYDWLLVHVSPP
jgi:uncharacterized protein (TIGR02453 family)